MASATTKRPVLALAGSDVQGVQPQWLDLNQVKKWIESGEPRSILNAEVTPEIAAVMLRHNPPGSNRKISNAYVSMLVRALQSGHWENTGEPIVFSDNGLLNDGQSRLTAIQEAGIAAYLDLRFGVPRHAFGATNSGRRRQAGEALRLSYGHGSVFKTAGVARMVLAYEFGLPQSVHLSYSNLEILGAVERWPDIMDAAAMCDGFGRSLNTSVTATIGFFARRTGDDDQVGDFFGVLRHGHGRGDAPAHMFREFTLKQRRWAVNKDDRVRMLAIGIIAWNAHRAGIHLKKLDWRRDAPFPVVKDLVL